MVRRESPGRPLLWLLGATVACYGIGYPVALLGHSAVGWVLVFLGGPCLIALGVLTVRWVHRTDAQPPAADARPSAEDARHAPPG